jgi:hypothetical protein
VNTKETTEMREKRLAIIQPLVTQGMKPAQISHVVGLSPEVIRHIIRRWCVRPEGYVRHKVADSLMDWQSECDPSILTDDQREHARRVGMSEGRYAWLLSCPKGMHVDLQRNQDNG